MKALYLVLFFLTPVFLCAQPQVKDSALLHSDSAFIKNVADSTAALQDSALQKRDSSAIASIPEKKISLWRENIERALQQSKYINSVAAPIASIARERVQPFNDMLFYLMLTVVLFLAFLRFFFAKYFNNLFRVFFNTSLRQSQLTDQLLQAKQVSLFFNILFTVTGGLYFYFLIRHFNWIKDGNAIGNIGLCILSVALIYFVKYISLKFTGWLTGYHQAANTYLFIIFLINKILGILLIPFIVVIAFAAGFLKYPAVLVSLLLIGLMFLLRFLRSYGLLRKEIKVSRFHFFIYIAGIELMPLLLIYKTLMVLFGKNL